MCVELKLWERNHHHWTHLLSPNSCTHCCPCAELLACGHLLLCSLSATNFLDTLRRVLRLAQAKQSCPHCCRRCLRRSMARNSGVGIRCIARAGVAAADAAAAATEEAAAATRERGEESASIKVGARVASQPVLRPRLLRAMHGAALHGNRRRRCCCRGTRCRRRRQNSSLTSKPDTQAGSRAVTVTGRDTNEPDSLAQTFACGHSHCPLFLEQKVSKVSGVFVTASHQREKDQTVSRSRAAPASNDDHHRRRTSFDRHSMKQRLNTKNNHFCDLKHETSSAFVDVVIIERTRRLYRIFANFLT